MILLDTNVVSELTRSHPDPKVDAFFRRRPPETLFIAAVCEAEIRYGLARLPPGRHSAAAALYGEIRVSRSATGKPIGIADAMIAATARAYGVALATRNVGDFAGCGILVANPWSDDC